MSFDRTCHTKEMQTDGDDQLGIQSESSNNAPVQEVTVTTPPTAIDDDDYFFFEIDGSSSARSSMRRTNLVYSEDDAVVSGDMTPPRLRAQRRHSITIDCSRSAKQQQLQLELEKNHIRLKLTHAELLTNFDLVRHKLRQTSQENTLLREQVADALKERDRAVEHAKYMLDLVESFKAQMNLMERERCQLKRLKKEDVLLVDF